MFGRLKTIFEDINEIEKCLAPHKYTVMSLIQHMVKIGPDKQFFTA